MMGEQDETVQAVERPETVPEKFWDSSTSTVRTDALLQSYAELEKRQGTAAPSIAPVGSVSPDGMSIQAAATPTSGAALEAAYNKSASGTPLTAEDYTALEASNIDKETADNYVTGRQAVFDNAKSKVLDIAGTGDEYKNMVAWASANLSSTEVEAYNSAMGTRDVGQMSLAVSGLKSRFIAAYGKEPTPLAGQPATQSGNTLAYPSTAAWYRDTGSPQYRTDPDFRDQVLQRLKVSNF